MRSKFCRAGVGGGGAGPPPPPHTPPPPPPPATAEGIAVAAWVPPDTALSTLAYPQLREVVAQALAILQP